MGIPASKDKIMKRYWWKLSLFLGTVAAIALTQAARAVELADGTTAFLQPPQFLSATTTNDSVMRRNATYFFTLDLCMRQLPENV